jgi:IS30 family transposase
MGSSIRFIAQVLKRSPSTISREIQRNGGSGDYYALRGEKSAAVRARRPTSAKLATHPALRAQVEAQLELRCSPQQISPVVSNDLP